MKARHLAPGMALLVAALMLLPGCAELMLVSAVTTMVTTLPSSEARWVETHRVSFDYAPDDVHALAVQEAPRSGRTIVEHDAASRTLTLSYPFSLLKNNWGGKIRVVCTPDSGGTTVTVMGDGRDAVSHVRAIGDALLADLEAALRRLPRTL